MEWLPVTTVFSSKKIFNEEQKESGFPDGAQMRPTIICHMLSSIDGKIDGSALDAVVGKGEYEATGAALHGDVYEYKSPGQSDILVELY